MNAYKCKSIYVLIISTNDLWGLHTGCSTFFSNICEFEYTTNPYKC